MPGSSQVNIVKEFNTESELGYKVQEQFQIWDETGQT